MSGAPTGRDPVDRTGATRGRRLIVAIVAIGLLCGAGLVVAGRRTSAAGTGAATDGATAPAPTGTSGTGGSGGSTKTAEVVRTDLVDRATVTGELGHGEATPLAVPGDGTITWLPEPGSIIERGGSVARVDERPVPLVYGTVPPYRDLSAASSDGADVRQLEEHLVALGHGDGVTVDDHFDAATQAAVQRWQDALGLERTGMVGQSQYVVTPGPVRVQERTARVGDRAGPGEGLTVTGTTRVVTVDLEPAKQSYVAVGDEAQIQLPDRRSVTGHVASVGTVATASDDQGNDPQGGDDTSSTIAVTLTLDDASKAGALDQAPVSVRIERSRAAGVLAVPVKALLVLKEGGYAVEVVDPATGTPSLTPVRTGSFADGLVEVTGAVAAGQRVVVAS